MKAIRGTVRGRVQGVGFRYSTVNAALRLGLSGWVRNTSDGAVEVHAQGSPEVIARFVEFLHDGPRAARVESVVLDDVGVDTTLDGFAVR